MRHTREKAAVQAQEGVHIDILQIPDFRREELARGALELIEQVFSVPGAEEEYQAWLKERRKSRQMSG